MKGQRHNWYSPAQLRKQKRRDALEREATRIIEAADRRKNKMPAATPAPSTMPQRLTLADLAMLRRQGRVP